MPKRQSIDVPAGDVAGTWKLDPVHSEVGFFSVTLEIEAVLDEG